MSSLIYLSVPYTSNDEAIREERVFRVRRAMANLIAQGRLVVCSVAMNHEAMKLLRGDPNAPGSGYWRDLEHQLAAACDELVVVALPGWETSSGVGREIQLFQVARKPVTLLKNDIEEVGLALTAQNLFEIDRTAGTSESF